MNNNRETSGSVKRYSSVYWLSLFFILAVSIFFFRGFLFNEYGGVRYYFIDDLVSHFILILFLLIIAIPPIVFPKISLERGNKAREERSSHSLIYFIKKYKEDFIIALIFLIVSLITTIIWSKTYNYRGQASDLFLMNDISRYTVFSGVAIMLITVFIKIIKIFRSTSPLDSEICNISLRKNIYYCFSSGGFRFLAMIMCFILFLGAFLSDLINRSTDETMVAVYIFFYMLFLTIPISIFIFMGMLIVTKGIKKSFISKLSFLLFTTITSILIFYVFFRMFLIDVYI